MSIENGETSFRREKDFLGEREVPAGAYFGIHSLRASENFALSPPGGPAGRLCAGMIKALGVVKKAAAAANLAIGEIPGEKAEAIFRACQEVIDGKLDGHFVVHPLQGGAGTASNMNVNEVVANRANELLGFPLGSYSPVHHLDDVNRSQSTNDVFPTALRIAAIWSLRELVGEIARFQETLQAKEAQFSKILKIGRTQLQDAVPITLGEEFSAYAEAISRDRWRLYRVEERLRVVNAGGTAIGTGITASRGFQAEFIRILREESGIGLARAENLVEATQNADVFVEVSGLLKPLAVTLGKLAGDLRLLASGPHAGLGEIRLPAVQEGSSIMPGKVNPVMCEMIGQIAMKVYGNDQIITHAAESGQLELNAFLPVIMDSLLGSLGLLKSGIALFREKCVSGLEANENRCRDNLRGSLGVLTVLAKKLGHATTSEVYLRHLETGRPIDLILVEGGFATPGEIEEALTSFRAR